MPAAVFLLAASTASAQVCFFDSDCPADPSHCRGAGNCVAPPLSPGVCVYPNAAAGTVCRASAGPCDVAETCTGTSQTCPANTYHSSTYTCRASAGVCDVAETCTGTSASCPANTLQPSTYTCRASAGVCDVAETCAGTSASCPANTLQPSTYTCRASAGVCDVAETCTGTSASCPADAFLAAGTTCRAAANDCDLAETCAGGSASCPADATATNGTACENASACMAGGTCQSSVCFGGTPELTFSPSDVALTGATPEAVVTVTHSGTGAAIQLTGASITPSGAFTIPTQPAWPVTLATAQQAQLTVRLNATEPGAYTATLMLQANGCADQPLALSATVDPPPAGGGGGGGGGGCSSAAGGGAGALSAAAALALAAVRRRRRS